MRFLWVLLLWLPAVCGAQQTPAPTVPTGSLSGTITDLSGALVPGATIVLSSDNAAAASSNGAAVPPNNATAATRKTVSDSDGDFGFTGVPAGGFLLAVTAPGMQSGAAKGTLLPGEQQDVPAIALRVAEQDTEVDVTFTRQELGVAEVQAEEHQRILGIIPNFSIAYDWNAPPMTTKQKYEVAWKESIDPVSIVLSAGLAGYQQAENDIPGFGQGAEGYFKRFGADMATGLTGTIIGGALLPQVFHQDPRYFWKGSGTVRQRFLYSISTVFICRSDRDGRWMPNYSNVIGDFTAGAISNVFYPASSRQGVSVTFENGATALGFGAVGNLFQEFLLHRLTPKLPRATPAPVGTQQP